MAQTRDQIVRTTHRGRLHCQVPLIEDLDKTTLDVFIAKVLPKARAQVLAVYRGTHVETASVSYADIVHISTVLLTASPRVPFFPVRSPCAGHAMYSLLLPPCFPAVMRHRLFQGKLIVCI